MMVSNEQKRAIVWSMVSVIMANGTVAPEEESMLIQLIYNELKESISILSESSSLTTNHAISILKTLSPEQKIAIVNYWDKLMMADGKIDPKEVQVIVAMSDAIGTDATTYKWLLGKSNSVLTTLQGTSWSTIDNNIDIAFDFNGANGCIFNGVFSLYNYDKYNDVIQISINECGLSKNLFFTILSQSQDLMTVSLNDKNYELIRKS